MDLTKKYMENQGTLGYLHKCNVTEGDHRAVIAYSYEGCHPKYMYCKDLNEANEKLEHWGKTGDLIIEVFDYSIGDTNITIEHPTAIQVLNIEGTYVRKRFPAEDNKKPW